VPSLAVSLTPFHSLPDARRLSGAVHSVSLLSRVPVSVKVSSRTASVGSAHYRGVLRTQEVPCQWKRRRDMGGHGGSPKRDQECRQDSREARVGGLADIKSLYRSSGARYRKGPLSGLSSNSGGSPGPFYELLNLFQPTAGAILRPPSQQTKSRMSPFMGWQDFHLLAKNSFSGHAVERPLLPLGIMRRTAHSRVVHAIRQRYPLIIVITKFVRRITVRGNLD